MKNFIFLTFYSCAYLSAQNTNMPQSVLSSGVVQSESEGKVGEQKSFKVSIPIIITNQMRMDLSMLGYTKDEMKHLTPEECWKIINKGVPKKPSRERGRSQ